METSGGRASDTKEIAMSRPVLLYCLAAFGCGVSLAVGVLVYMRALRLAQGYRRRLLWYFSLAPTVVLTALCVLFRSAGRMVGVGWSDSVQIGVVLLIVVPPSAVMLWYMHKYPRAGRPEPKGQDE